MVQFSWCENFKRSGRQWAEFALTVCHDLPYTLLKGCLDREKEKFPGSITDSNIFWPSLLCSEDLWLQGSAYWLIKQNLPRQSKPKKRGRFSKRGKSPISCGFSSFFQGKHPEFRKVPHFCEAGSFWFALCLLALSVSMFVGPERLKAKASVEESFFVEC